MSEFKLHCAIVELLNLSADPRVLWWHNASGEHRSAITGARLKRMGVKRGVPDLMFILADGCAALMEIKFGKGRMTPEQAAFRAGCEQKCVPYAVVRSIEEAIAVFQQWKVLRQRSFAESGSRRANRESSPRAEASAR